MEHNNVITGYFRINHETKKLEPLTAENKADLPRGTILHMNGYNNPDFVIISKEESRFGINYKSINLDTFAVTTHTANYLMFEHEKKDGRIQTYITDRKMSEEEIETTLHKCELAKIAKEEAEKKAKEAEIKRIEELKKEYSFLTTKEQVPNKSHHALGAANIRTELKRTFPGVKFSVTGGCSISVNWTDGPTNDDVEEITGKYQKGHFNSMDDIYEHDYNNYFPDIYGGAMYIHTGRKYSKELIQAVADREGIKIIFDQYGYYEIDTDKEWDKKRSIEFWLNDALNKESAYNTISTPEEVPVLEPDTAKDNKPADIIIGEYNGHPTLTISNDNGDKMTFGIKKAKAIIKYLEEIKKFVEMQEI